MVSVQSQWTIRRIEISVEAFLKLILIFAEFYYNASALKPREIQHQR